MSGTSGVRTDSFVPGEVISGKYVIERILGVGGVGVVVAARHVELDETVALKFLHPQMQGRNDVVQRFANEARAAVRIKSEYAARIFDVGNEPERGPYFVMEYLEGKDLGEVLEGGPLPLRAAVEFMLEACEALASAHANGIIHRDIKPENLFISRRSDGTEVMKVLDFGISKASLTGSMLGAGSLVKTQELMGTPLYMSPEQIRSTASVDHRTDIWSLGVCFYEMLTRECPFSGDSIPGVCASVIETQPRPLQDWVALPGGVQAIVDRCLQKDPALRFKNVAELAVALVPFGPTKGRVFAERTSAILQAAGHSSDVSYRFSSAPPESTSFLALPSIPRAPLVPSVSAPHSSRSSERVLVTGPPSARTGPLDLSVEADAFRPSPRGKIIAAGAVILGLALAAAFLLGTRRADLAAPAKTAVSVPSAVAEPPMSAAPAEVTISVAARPADAKLYLDDVVLASNPIKLKLVRDGRPHALRAEAAGHTTRSVATTFDLDKEVILALDRAATPTRAWAPARGEPKASSAAPPVAASPAAPKETAGPAVPVPTTKNMDELDTKRTKRPIRALDTAQPW